MVERLAAKIAGGAPDRMAVARRIYEWCVANLKYDTSGEGWGRGDTLWACDSRRGDCTDFHSVFTALARAEGIPARFVMGYPLPAGQESGEVDGYHCWAEFYTLDSGWVPVDASDAALNPEYHEYYFGRLTPDRFVMSVGRDLEMSPPQEGGALNFLYEAYAEADKLSVGEVETTVRFGPA
jgi:transglutaminase-like putative cysteine protease